MKLSRSIATLAAALATLVGGVMAAPQVSAQPANSVVFGDSIVANPAILDYVGHKLGGNVPSNGSGCVTDRTFSGAFGRGAGLPAADYTCAGASLATGGQRVSHQIHLATQQGYLGHHTREVAIMAGANDSYTRLREQPAGVQNTVRIATRKAVEQVRAAAPNARIKVVGYPTIANHQGFACPVNLIPNHPSVLPVNVGQWENAVQWGQVYGAQEAGAQFVDLKPITANHGMCSPSRWIVGLVDTTAPAYYNMGFHMTTHGLNQVGEHAGRV